jgi:hypothetical protein
VPRATGNLVVVVIIGVCASTRFASQEAVGA